MKNNTSIITLSIALVAGWCCIAYASAHIRNSPPSPPTEWDQQVYAATRDALSTQTNVVNAIATPENQYEQDTATHRHKRLGLIGLLLVGSIVTFRSGYILSETCGINGWLGGFLAILTGPLSLALVLKRN